MQKALDLSKNTRAILENIIQNGTISQNEIANQTNINRSIVSKEIANLENTKLLKIVSEKNKKVISFNHQFANTILIEIDRYFIHAFLNTSLGFNLDTLTIKIDVMEVSDLFSHIEQIIDQFLAKSKKQVIGIAFSVHGIVEKNHIISYAPNTNWNHLNLKDVIESKYDIFTAVLNVANVSVMSESVLSEPSLKSLVSLNIHSGVGAGFMFNDKLFIGSNGRSLEVGHFELLGHTRQCDCGGRGCLETEIAYPRLIDRLREFGHQAPSIELLIDLYNQGDPDIIKLYDEYLTLVAHGVRNLLLVIDPDEIRINCEIFQNIPKSIEILKSKMHLSIKGQAHISISTLNSSTRCIGLSLRLTGGYLGLSAINLYSQRQLVVDSYSNKKK